MVLVCSGIQIESFRVRENIIFNTEMCCDDPDWWDSIERLWRKNRGIRGTLGKCSFYFPAMLCPIFIRSYPTYSPSHDQRESVSKDSMYVVEAQKTHFKEPTSLLDFYLKSGYFSV